MSRDDVERKMNFEELKDSIPDYAKDLKLNLSSLRNPIPGMTETQVLGCMLACAINTKNAIIGTSGVC